MEKENIKEFLIKNESLLRENNLTKLYENSNMFTVPSLTRFFISSHINPLEYMNMVPSFYDEQDPNLLEIEIPNNIIVINKFAFADCPNLRKVIISDSVQLIGHRAFQNCNKLEELKLGDKVNQIIESFFGCKSLKNIYLPESLEYITGYAFDDCISLKELKLPKGLKIIDVTAFPPKLNELIIPQNTDLGINYASKNMVKLNLSELKYPITYKEIKYDNGEDFYTKVVEPLY